MSDEMGIFEVIYNCRAMRRLKPDSVPEELLTRLIEAANQGPTGSNAQLGRWIVVRDPAQKARLAELNKKAVNTYVGPGSGRPTSLPHQPAEKRARMLKSVMWQAEHMQEIPALIIACAEFAAPVSPAESMAAGRVDLAGGAEPPARCPCSRARSRPDHPWPARPTRGKEGARAPRHDRAHVSDSGGLSAGKVRSRHASAGTGDHALGPLGVAPSTAATRRETFCALDGASCARGADGDARPATAPS